MRKKAAPTPPVADLPQSGGSYTRTEDGQLVKEIEPSAPQPKDEPDAH